MKQKSLKNNVKAFIKKYFKRLWYIKEAQNDEKMLKRYSLRKTMADAERREVIRRDYLNYIGREPDLDNPKAYTEKIQWRKLYEKDTRLRDYSDKVLVREWIKEKIGEEYLIPICGVYDKFDDIDFSVLPDRFVLKTNHSSGWNVIVKNKKKLDLKRVKKKFDLWLSLDYSFVTGFEMQYQGIKPKILCENYLEDKNGELQDYKFLCFGGEVKYCWVDCDRYGDHKRNMYDTNWNLQPWNQKLSNSDEPVEKPENFEKMVELANILCKDFSHVRVDFYNLDGKIYFGEMTFTNGSGYEKIIPDSFDYELGRMWNDYE